LKIWRTHFLASMALATVLSFTAATAQETSPAPPAANPPAAEPAATNPPANSTAQAPTSPSAADQSKNSPDKKADDAKAGEAKDKDKDKDKGATSNDRLFFALPNFLTLEGSGQVPPLTAGQKYKVVARSAFDKVQFGWYGFLAGISQAENSEPGYGQGMEGYGKRYGAAFADGTIENFMTGAVLPSIFRQDPRFFQSSTGGFTHRAGYAVSRIFITRSDSGHSQFNVSEILGSAASAAISTYSYHPSGDRTFSNTMSVWGTQVGYDTVTIVIKEFWPDIRRKLHKEKKDQK
jgi:hypothetical protein